ncbi:MAG TPA: hypothetical protein VM656_08355 [Pyrinomonadaceae bacterium]|nr:hypothetical protein [Pyrinomonadaceae bacterium]
MASTNKKNAAAQQEPSEETAASTREIIKRRALDELVVEVMGGGSAYTRDELMAISSFDDAVRIATEVHGSLTYADQELGDGFALLSKEQKNLLCGVPLLLLEWKFRGGDFGNFVTMRVIARNPDGNVSKYIVNDGSTGIAEQLADYQTATQRTGGMFVGKGFRRSDYEVEIDGETRGASTYYLDTSKA